MTADLADHHRYRHPTGLLIGGQWSSGRAGTLPVINPATEDAITEVADASPEDALEAVGAAAAGAARVGRHGRRGSAGECLRRAYELMTAAVRAAGAADGAGERQGAAGRARRDPVRGRVLPLVRRGGGPDRRPPVGRAVGRQPDHGAAPAGRRQLHDHAVELPGGDGHQEDRPGAGGRLHGRAQAGQGDAADRAGGGRHPGRGRRAGRRGQRAAHPQARPADRGGAGRPAGAQAVLHRVHRGRPDAAQAGRRLRDQLLDGARRQRAVPGLRRRRHRRGGGRRVPRQDAQRRRGMHRGQPVLRAREGRDRVLGQARRAAGGAQRRARPARTASTSGRW